MAYIRKRGKKYYYTLEYTDDEGKHHRHERCGGLTAKEAKIAWRAAMSEIDKTGGFYEEGNIKLEMLLNEWLVHFEGTNPRENTLRSYRSIVKNHIVPELGTMQLKRIKPKHLQNLLNQKSKNLSQGTLIIIRSVLKQSFVYATDFCEYIFRNPAANIKLPKYLTPTKEATTFTSEQINALSQKFPHGHHLYMPLMLSYHTGMRVGECLGLRWDDVNLQDRTIRVQATMIENESGAVIQEAPKSLSSNRILPFGDKLYQIFKAEKAHQAGLRLAAGPFFQNNNLVCCHYDGSLLSSSDIRWFNIFCKKSFGEGSFHTLRHTHATMLLEAGLELELVSKRLGHSSIAITAKIYSHVLEKRTTRTVNMLNNIL